MTNVIPMSAYTRMEVDPDTVLEGAKGQLTQVLIIGKHVDGFMYAAASTPNKEKLLMALEEFKFQLLSGEFDD
jgi:hypothetical protein